MLPLSLVLPLLTTPVPLPVLFVESWATVRVFVLRKMAFLIKIIEAQILVVIKRFVLIATKLVILLMFATRNMGTLPGIDLSMVSLFNPTTSPLPFKKKILVIKIKTRRIAEEISASHIINTKFFRTFWKNVNNSNNQVQVNQVGSLSADHQYQNLAVTSNIKKLKNSNLNEYTWILDFCATNHVCFSLSTFTSYKHIKPITIKLPNGNYVIASCSGTIFFNKNFILENVLFVPDFSFNLIFIFQLTTSLKCELIFSSTKCLIHNSITKDKIGTVDLVAGLYVFNKTDSRIISCTAN